MGCGSSADAAVPAPVLESTGSHNEYVIQSSSSNSLPPPLPTASQADPVPIVLGRPRKSDPNVPLVVLIAGKPSLRVVAKKKTSPQLFSVKILRKHTAGSAEAYQAECNVMKFLRHPNIDEIQDSVEDADSFRIITKLHSGGDLISRLTAPITASSLSEAMIAIIVKQMVDAVAYCHGMNVAHRNIMPNRFVFESQDPHAAVKLVDFGAAVVAQDDEAVSSLAGTSFYTAPEILSFSAKPRTGRAWRAADMWSLGATVYLLLHGVPAFSGIRVFRKIRAGKIRNADSSYLSTTAQDFLDQLLKVDPEQRMTAKQALAHPFVAQCTSLSWNAFPKQVGVSLQQFRMQQAFGRLVSGKLDQPQRDNDETMLRNLFRKFDTNGDGRVNMTELGDLLKHMGKTTESAKEFLEAFDQKGEHAMDIRHFARVFRDSAASSPATEEVIRFVDSNGASRMEPGSLASALKVSVNEAEVACSLLNQHPERQIDLFEFFSAFSTEPAHVGQAAIHNTSFDASDYPNGMITFDEWVKGSKLL